MLASLTLAALAGCGTDPIDPGETRHYALSSLLVVHDDDGNALGVDVDGITSDGAGTSCTAAHADYVSVSEPGVVGVDNALADHAAQLADPDGDGPCTSIPDYRCETIHAGWSIAAGRWLIIVEVAGIHDDREDDDVEVVVHRGTISGSPALEGERLAPNQSFALEEIARSTEASIHDGRLRARFDALLLPPWRDGTMTVAIAVPLHTAQLSADISSTGMSQGAIGGAMSVDEVATALTDVATPGQVDTFRSLADHIADLAPDPTTPERCRAYSMGFGFDAVPALPL